ncbi:MAG: PD40 domain-containing protein [Deltaproteobacteria bacterium]|nr:PD40 domain-containing protein [Deltaproteobacteria bacterium]
MKSREQKKIIRLNLRFFLTLPLLLALTLSYGCTPGKLLTKIDKESVIAGSVLIDTQNKTVIYIAKEREDKGGGQYLVINNQREKTFDFIRRDIFVFSPEGNTVAYVAKKGSQWLTVINGEEGEPFQAIARKTLVFSPNGERVAYGAQKNNKWLVVLDGKSGPTYEMILMKSLVFSPSSARFAVAFSENSKSFVILDNIKGNLYDEILPESITFSPDNKKLAYAARAGADWFIVTHSNGVVTRAKSFDKIFPKSLVFSPDSKRLFFSATKNKFVYGVLGDELSPPYKYIAEETTRFSPNGEVVAYAAKKPKQWFFVSSGEPAIGPYASFGRESITFSPNGSNLAYIAKNKDGWIVVVNQIAHEPYDAVMKGTLQLDDDGLATYVVINDGEVFVVQRKPGVSEEPKKILTLDKRILLKKGGRVVFDTPKKIHYITRNKLKFYATDALLP